MLPNIFQPILNRDAPVGPLTHIIVFKTNVNLTACQPGTQTPNQPSIWNIFDNLQSAIPDASIPLANNQGFMSGIGPNDGAIWNPTSCVYPIPYSFKQGEKYYANKVPNYQGNYNPNPTMDWEIQVNGLRYRLSQYSPQITVIGNAHSLKQKINLIYAAIIIFVLALSLRYFTKK